MNSSIHIEQSWISAIQEVLGLATDSETAQCNSKEKLATELTLSFANLLASLPQPALLTDSNGFIIEVNDELCQLFHYHRADLKGESIQKLYAPLHNKQFFKQSWHKILEQQQTKQQLWHHSQKGLLIPVELNSLSLANKVKDDNFFLHILTDLSHSIDNQSKLEKLATRDHLTDLPNRFSILQRLKNDIASLKNNEQRCAVVFIDLDGFKKINDVYGHQTGDKLMLAGIKRLKNVIADEFLGRLGGDEFVLIYPFTDQQVLNVFLERILASFLEPFTVEQHDLFLGINLGVSIAPTNSCCPEELINQADMALHAIKNSEKRIQFYTQEFLHCMQRQLKIEHYLKQAIENETLNVFFQPKYNLITNKIVGLEALLRWHHEELGDVSPDEFIDIAENAGLIVSVGRYVLNLCARLIAKQQAQAQHCVPIAVNISGHHFSQSNIYQDVLNVLKQYAIAPKYLEIEITENVLMMDYDNVITQLTQLKQLGVKISIDDFGTGHSSLERLANLPIDSLKIDRSFVLELNEQPQKQAIIKAVLSMSDALGLTSIAEGIETESQEQFLRFNKCQFGQGYLFAKPINEEDTISLLKQRIGN
ncbi:putative bifunctional diguanylate cyclase/phosphodiesterase [Thalassotalea ganghwensis]